MVHCTSPAPPSSSSTSVIYDNSETARKIKRAERPRREGRGKNKGKERLVSAAVLQCLIDRILGVISQYLSFLGLTTDPSIQAVSVLNVVENKERNDFSPLIHDALCVTVLHCMVCVIKKSSDSVNNPASMDVVICRSKDV